MHPDLGGDHWHAALINEAFAALSDPEKRAAYDRSQIGRIVSERTDQTTVDPDSQPAPAPQTQQSSQTPGQSGRRAVERMPRSFPLHFSTGVGKTALRQGQAVDLSPNGIQFVAPEPLTPGHIVTLDSALCSALGAVRRCAMRSESASASQECRIGVEFLTLNFNRQRGNFVSAQA